MTDTTVAWRPPRLTYPATAVISARQAQILAGICHGYTDERIGRDLHITKNTVKTHIKRLLRAVDARDRTHLAALACSGQIALHVHSYRTLEKRPA